MITERAPDLNRIEWLQKANTLHRQVEILYVVDGYEVTLTWDGHAISEDFHGETLGQAIDKAMSAFDLSSPAKFVDGDRLTQDPVDRQLVAVEKQRDKLLVALNQMMSLAEHLCDAGGWDLDAYVEYINAKATSGTVTGGAV